MTDKAGHPYVRKELTPLLPIRLAPDEVPASIDEAYRLLLAETAGDRAYGKAWKLGGTTESTRRTFNVDRLYFGPLHESEILLAPTRAPGKKLFELKGEAEIALRISEKAVDLTAVTEAQIDAAALAELFDAWCITLELPSSPVENLVEAGVNALVADRCAAGALILGPQYSINTAADWHRAALRIDQDGKVLAEGGVDFLVDAPDVCARQFLKEARRVGFSPRSGDWISTGGLTPCVKLAVGGIISVLFNEVEVISFEAASNL
jgi:2-keto-4-pentenoate hydratase